MSESGLAARWLESAAGGSVAAARRLERGRAGAGRLVPNIRVEPGRFTVTVPEGRGRSHRVVLAVDVVEQDAWAALVEELGTKLRYTADLLEGHLPGIAVTVLLPPSVDEHCPCTESKPCRHIAAAHHAVAVALARDPFLLVQVHGHRREDLLNAVRASRSTDTADRAVDLSDPLAARGDLDAIEVHPVPSPDVDLLFHQLGSPPGIDPPDQIAVLMEDAAALAWRLAAGEGADTADDEALLAELRAQSVATADAIADSLGLDVARVQEDLDRLHAEGQVLRMGSGPQARYRAA